MKLAWWMQRGIGMTQRERVRRAVEAAVRKTAWMMPRKVAYWCAIRVISNATTGAYSGQVVPELTAMDALKRWDAD